MARPGGNTTGISILATELDGKRQEILIEAVPGLRRMAAVGDSSTLSETKAHALKDAARGRHIDLEILRIANGEEIGAAIDKAQASGVTALNVLASPMLHAGRAVRPKPHINPRTRQHVRAKCHTSPVTSGCPGVLIARHCFPAATGWS
jgi:putative ABC transport system substrate-binding protein